MIRNIGFGRSCAAPPLIAAALLLAPTVQAAPLEGLGQGDLVVRGTVKGSFPVNVASEVAPPIGGKVDISSSVLPALDIRYFLTDRWSLELSGGVTPIDYSIEDSALGDFDVGTIDTGAVMLLGQYHFRPQAQLNPYVGLGAVYIWADRITPEEGIPDFEVDSFTGLVLDAGLDYHLSGNWFASASLQYFVLPTYKFKSQGFNTEVDMNNITLGAGVGYRF